MKANKEFKIVIPIKCKIVSLKLIRLSSYVKGLMHQNATETMLKSFKQKTYAEFMQKTDT